MSIAVGKLTPSLPAMMSLENDTESAKFETLKGHVQGLGWFLTRFPLKFAENNDVDETVIWGL